MMTIDKSVYFESRSQVDSEEFFTAGEETNESFVRPTRNPRKAFTNLEGMCSSTDHTPSPSFREALKAPRARRGIKANLIISAMQTNKKETDDVFSPLGRV